MLWWWRCWCCVDFIRSTCCFRNIYCLHRRRRGFVLSWGCWNSELLLFSTREERVKGYKNIILVIIKSLFEFRVWPCFECCALSKWVILRTPQGQRTFLTPVKFQSLIVHPKWQRGYGLISEKNKWNFKAFLYFFLQKNKSFLSWIITCKYEYKN